MSIRDWNPSRFVPYSKGKDPTEEYDAGKMRLIYENGEVRYEPITKSYNLYTLGRKDRGS